MQARLQLATCILLPNDADPSRVDLVRIFGFVDLLRLRDDLRWPLARRTFFDESLSKSHASECAALEPGPPGERSGLIREFSSEAFPELDAEDGSGAERCILPAGVPGRTGRLTAIFGCCHRAIAGRPGDEGDRPCPVMANLLTPVERLHFDLLVHEDLPWSRAPGVALLGGLDSGPPQNGARQPGLGLPFTEAVVDLGAGIAGRATPHMPRYLDLLEWVFLRLGAEPTAFRAFRFAMAFPPLPAKVVLHPAPPLPARSAPGT